MSDWKNRTKYDKITQEVIAQVPDDLLAWAMFDYIRLRIGSDYERTLEVLAELPLARRHGIRRDVLGRRVDPRPCVSVLRPVRLPDFKGFAP